jgi:signal transduction histidine kinase
VPGLHATNQVSHAVGETIPKPRKLAWSDDVGVENSPAEISTEPFLLRVSVLWLLTLCCYGAQVLIERQRIALEEAGEFAARESQLRSAGRLAAEFAHQIKNPLAVINNTAFSLQRSLRDGKADAAQQIEIIQEEVARADRVITQITGYAQLSEGRVEKLDAVAELDRAIAQVFPPAVPTQIIIHREYAAHFPPLLMQRGHLSEILVNLLQNAREALGEKGNVFVTAGCRRDYSIEISVRDDGPGVPPDKTERIFEAYYTTKEKGTGLGLAIVKHNIELYGGTVRVESKSGHGAKFLLFFPAKALMKLSKT